jgi:hypothetical protein
MQQQRLRLQQLLRQPERSEHAVKSAAQRLAQAAALASLLPQLWGMAYEIVKAYGSSCHHMLQQSAVPRTCTGTADQRRRGWRLLWVMLATDGIL